MIHIGLTVTKMYTFWGLPIMRCPILLKKQLKIYFLKKSTKLVAFWAMDPKSFTTDPNMNTFLKSADQFASLGI